jgi:hopanoid-associated phosphorylase
MVVGAGVMSNVEPVVAVTCLAFEASIAAGPRISVLCGSARQRAGEIASLIRAGSRGVISIGIAGGLDPRLRPGDWVVAASVVGNGVRYPSDERWSRRLLAALPGAVHADVAGVDAPVTDAAAKAALRRATGTAAADMESHIAAEVAAEHRVPFAACRVVIDPAHRAVPAAALAGLRHDGATDVRALLAHLVRQPAQLGPLLRIVADARAASASLIRGRRRIGDGLGFPYIGAAGHDEAVPREAIGTLATS